MVVWRSSCLPRPPTTPWPWVGGAVLDSRTQTSAIARRLGHVGLCELADVHGAEVGEGDVQVESVIVDQVPPMGGVEHRVRVDEVHPLVPSILPPSEADTTVVLDLVDERIGDAAVPIDPVRTLHGADLVRHVHADGAVRAIAVSGLRNREGRPDRLGHVCAPDLRVGDLERRVELDVPFRLLGQGCVAERRHVGRYGHVELLDGCGLRIVATEDEDEERDRVGEPHGPLLSGGVAAVDSGGNDRTRRVGAVRIFIALARAPTALGGRITADGATGAAVGVDEGGWA